VTWPGHAVGDEAEGKDNGPDEGRYHQGVAHQARERCPGRKGGDPKPPEQTVFPPEYQGQCQAGEGRVHQAVRQHGRNKELVVGNAAQLTNPLIVATEQHEE